MTARVQETLIAVTIASVDVHTNATISESPIATPLHTEGGPVLGSRLLPDIWTSPASPLVISEARRLTADPRRLTADPVAYAEARRLTAHPVTYSEVRRITAVTVASSGGRRLTAVPVACSEACPHGGPRRLLRGSSPLRGASPHGGPRRLLRGASPHGGPQSPTQRRVASRRSPSPTQRRVASKGSPPTKRMGLAPVAGPSSSRRPLYRDFRSPRRSSRDFLSPQRGSPSSKRRRYEARDSVSPQQLHSSRASSQEPSQELYRSLHTGSSHHDSRRYLRFVEEERTSSESSASG